MRPVALDLTALTLHRGHEAWLYDTVICRYLEHFLPSINTKFLWWTRSLCNQTQRIILAEKHGNNPMLNFSLDETFEWRNAAHLLLFLNGGMQLNFFNSQILDRNYSEIIAKQICHMTRWLSQSPPRI
uniref:Uncharacterized protein n=1 Tax=Acrobeloides nanus TaxID=290746 RepID=A0A914EN32_9BILA